MFGIAGLVGSIVSMLVLSSGRGANLNMRAAFLEVVNDALGSVAVIMSAVVIALTGWTRIDALAGMLIAGLIVPRALPAHHSRPDRGGTRLLPCRLSSSAGFPATRCPWTASFLTSGG